MKKTLKVVNIILAVASFIITAYYNVVNVFNKKLIFDTSKGMAVGDYLFKWIPMAKFPAGYEQIIMRGIFLVLGLIFTIIAVSIKTTKKVKVNK